MDEKFHINYKSIKKIWDSEKGETKTQKLKHLMEEELNKSNKKIVVFIENIDRASKENVITLFRMLGTIFNLSNIVYVLAYDKDRLEEVFQDREKINSNYIKKIINQEISIPEIRDDIKCDIFTKCSVNIMKAYGLNNKDISEVNFVIEFINNNIKDLRDYKRLINSAFYLTFGSFQRLTYSPEKLSLNIIRFLNTELYNYIVDNKWFFAIGKYPTNLEEAFAKNTQKAILLEKEETGYMLKYLRQNHKEYIELLVNTYPLLKDANNTWKNADIKKLP